MTPLDASPDRWTSHPATLGYGTATAFEVAILLVAVALVGRLVLRWRDRHR